jgi:acyl-CoA reductase-like NAD-dependent aldehyde dehydrogenase
VNVRAAERFIPTVLELGGKDVGIVTRNANLERAANGILWGGYTNCGQTCIGTELILVDRAVYDTFLKMMIERVETLELGKGVGQIGCMTMASQAEIVKEHLEDALAKGARVVATGKDNGLVGQGNWTAPMLVAEVTPDMKLYHEETFGPVRAIIAYNTIEEAINLANGTRYGLSASIYDKDHEEARRIGERIKTGSVNINDALLTYGVPGLPFGGVKESGLGYYHGKMGLQSFCDVKSYTECRLPTKTELHWYPIWHNSDRVFEDMMKFLYGRKMGTRLKGVLGCTKGMIEGIRGPKKG